MSEPPTDTDHEALRRRNRTLGYLKLWGINADLTPLPVPLRDSYTPHELAAVVGRAKSLCLVALKGQGLSLRESFAFADAYGVWDHLTIEEHDFVLEPEPSRQELVQFAWRFEGLRVMEWALGIVKHLGFPVDPADPAVAVQLCMEKILNASTGDVLELRSTKELLDAADVTWSLTAVSAALQAAPVEGVTLHPGVVHERSQGFTWLVRTGWPDA